jgi:serine protease Do
MNTLPFAINRKKLAVRAVWLAAPAIIGALALQAISPATATEREPALVFERVQFADVIERTQPAVVKIDVKKTMGEVARLQGQPGPFGPGGMDELMRRFGGIPFPFAQRGAPPAVTAGLGSGFIIDASGLVVTNNHVIDGATEMSVTLHDGRQFTARLVGRDELTDLALLQIEGAKDLPTVSFGDSEHARVGDWVVAIGSPFGLGGSVTAGIISARGRDIHSGPYDDYLQIDAPINSGNSGGPILNASGEVIGVNTAIFSPNGGNIGIGFAIPAADAEQVIAELQHKGSVTRGWLGVQIQEVTPEVAEAFSLGEAQGALVSSVQSDSPAARAGVQVGDVIQKFNGEAVDSPRELSRSVARTEPGEKYSIEVMRKGESRRLVAVVDHNPNSSETVAQIPANGAPDDDLGLGLALGALSPAARDKLALEDPQSGALVLGVKSGGAADRGGLAPGDVIVQVNQRNVTDKSDAEKALRAAAKAERPLVVLVRRGESQFFATVKPA